MPMTQRQKRIIVILAIADIIVILALVGLVTQATNTRTSPDAPLSTPAQSPQTCQWQATQLLARTGIAGTVALTSEGPLRFHLDYPLAPDQTVEDAAQSVWTAFDVALALQKKAGCAFFTHVEVTILAHNGRHTAQISANVSAADLAAFGDGELSEEQFLERVTYATNAVRDE